MSYEKYLEILEDNNGTFKGASSDAIKAAIESSEDPVMDRSAALMAYRSKYNLRPPFYGDERDTPATHDVSVQRVREGDCE